MEWYFRLFWAGLHHGVKKNVVNLRAILILASTAKFTRNFDKVYDGLKRDWAEKFLSVDKEDIDSAPLASSDEQQHWSVAWLGTV